MPRIKGPRETRQLLFYDTLLLDYREDPYLESYHWEWDKQTTYPGMIFVNMFQAASGGDLRVTNMEGLGCFPFDQSASVNGLDLHCAFSDPTMIRDLFLGCTFELFVAQMSQTNLPFAAFADPARWECSEAGVPVTAYPHGISAGYPLQTRPIDIPPRQNFRVVTYLDRAFADKLWTLYERKERGTFAMIRIGLDCLLTRDIL